MKPPPLLLGAALLFWGWQSDLLPVSALLAVVVESAWVVHRRWEFSDEDFSRVWTLCALLFLGSAIYAFTANDVPSAFSGYLENPSFSNQRRAGGASARTAAAMFRWLPMIFFPFLTANLFSTREAVPLATISLIMRRRWRRALAAGHPLPRNRNFHMGYPYFLATLLASSVHPGTDYSFFGGLAALLGWSLWTLRSRRFHFTVWAATLVAALSLGFLGQAGIGQLQSYLERLNPAWLQRWLQRGTDPSRSRTAIGDIGNLKLSGKIVIRLRTPEGQRPPEYLREASYREYRSRTWYASGRRESFDGGITEEYLNSRSWNLLPARRSNSVAQISCGLPGGIALLPLPSGTWRLENLGAYVLKKNDLGAVQCEGPGLVVFDAHYGPGEWLDSGPNEDDRLAIPPEEVRALDLVAKELKLGSTLPAKEVMRRLQNYFTERYTYSTYQSAPPEGRKPSGTALGRFLLETHSGHCEYFATAATLLLRYACIPTRYAVGYYVHEGKNDKYVVRLRDAHAWCLVWDEEIQQWVNFDPTPSTWLEKENSLRSAFEWLGDAWTRFTFELARLRWGQNELRQYLFLLIVPGLLVLGYQIFFRRRRARRQAELDADAARRWPGLDSEFYQLERALADRGWPRPAGEPLADWLARAMHAPELIPLRGNLETLLRLHYRYRFDPAGLDAAERDQLRMEARWCLEEIARILTPSPAAR